MSDVMYEVDGVVLSEGAYANRVLPPRESPFEAGSMLIASAAIVFAIAAVVGAAASAANIVQLTSLVDSPFKPGFLAIFLGIIALATAGDRGRIQRFALAFATLAWLVGGVIAVLADKPIF
jgi:hypothetical protein